MMPPMRILHIEDNTAHAELVKDIIAEWSDETVVVTAGTASDGMRALVHHTPFDLVLLDVNLPDESGIDVLRKMKHDSFPPHVKRTPVVMLTTSPALEDYHAAMESCSAAYLIKPIRYAEFTKIVRRTVEFYKYAREPR